MNISDIIEEIGMPDGNHFALVIRINGNERMIHGSFRNEHITADDMDEMWSNAGYMIKKTLGMQFDIKDCESCGNMDTCATAERGYSCERWRQIKTLKDFIEIDKNCLKTEEDK